MALLARGRLLGHARQNSIREVIHEFVKLGGRHDALRPWGVDTSHDRAPFGSSLTISGGDARRGRAVPARGERGQPAVAADGEGRPRGVLAAHAPVTSAAADLAGALHVRAGHEQRCSSGHGAM
jgi:hypothetical protein